MSKSQKVSFQDIKSAVLARIQDRTWAQGALLPTEQELAAEFECARATVNRALRELAEDGVVNRKRKSGTRVTTSPSSQAKVEIAVVRRTIEDMNAVYRYALVERRMIDAPDWLSAQLDLPIKAQVLHLKCMHFADNRPFQFEERWISVDAVPHVADVDFTTSGPNEWLLAEAPFSDAEIAFSATSATEAMAAFLATSQGTALMQMERTTWFQGKAVTFVRMTFHPGYQVRSRF